MPAIGALADWLLLFRHSRDLMSRTGWVADCLVLVGKLTMRSFSGQQQYIHRRPLDSLF